VTPVAPLGIGTSIVLITVGAILKYAITEGEIWFLDIEATGTILLLIGILALVLAIVYGFLLTNRARGPEVVRERERPDVVREREYYDDPTRRRERY
jgi:hypothetical protein